MRELLRFLKVLAVGLFLAGCAPQQPHLVSRPDLKDAPYCVLLIVDALGPDALERLIKNGDLPNIQKHIVDRGMCAENMISVFPSVTAGAITSIVTGTFPGRHQIPNFTWIDRKTGKYRCYLGTDITDFESDLYQHAHTIFHYLPKEDTASFGLIQGEEAGKDEGMIVTVLNPFHEYMPLSHIALSDMFAKFGMGRGIPHLLAHYEWGVDVRGHREGRYSQGVRSVMQRVDHQLGKIVRAYQESGIYDKTYFVLVSDHGLAQVREYFFIDQAFHNAGFRRKLISYNLGESLFPTTWSRADSIWLTQERIFEYNAIIGSAGGGAAAIDLVMNGGRGPDGKFDKKLWEEMPVYQDLLRYDLGEGVRVKQRYVDVIKFIRDMEPVDLFFVRENRPAKGGPSKVLVGSRKGLARVTRKTGGAGNFVYSYEVVKGTDPLGYLADEKIRPLAQSGFHDGLNWLNATAHHAYPDVPVLITSMFDTPRSGTVVVSMGPGWGINLHSSIIEKHSGYLREEMIATFCVSGPGLSHGEFHAGRIVDVTPTILALLGEPDRPYAFDGRPIPEIVSQVRKE